MKIVEFRGKVKPGKVIVVEEQELEVLQVIKFRLDDGSFYFKCFLSDDWVIAEDAEMNVFIFVRPIETAYSEPMPKRISLDGKEFDFLYEAHAVAEEVWGEKTFKKGEAERFWDYRSADGSYLSLGVDELTGKKADFYGRIVSVDKVNLK